MSLSTRRTMMIGGLGIVVFYAILKKVRNSQKQPQRTELVLDSRRRLGEGAIWDSENNVLLWVDVVRSKLFVYDPTTKFNRMVDFRQMIGTVVPRKGYKNQVVAALHRGVCIADISKPSVQIIKWLGNPTEEINKFNNRFNDGKCDPQGRLWAGTMDLTCKQDEGALYCINTDHSIDIKVSPATIPNGIVWTKDTKTLYWIDTPKRCVDAFDFYSDTGIIKNRRCAVEVKGPGYPDGCTIDNEDTLWIAKWDGWCVERYDPRTQTLLSTYPIPCAQVTSVAFGGPALDQLFITTARCGLSADQLKKQPLAGGLFKIDFSQTNIRGVPAQSFAG